MSRSCEFLDESLDILLQLRDRALADVDAPDRASRLARVFEAEARLWSRYYERTRSRPLWRAALAAEAWARHNAAVWRARADTSQPVAQTAAGSASADRISGEDPRSSGSDELSRGGSITPRDEGVCETASSRLTEPSDPSDRGETSVPVPRCRVGV